MTEVLYQHHWEPLVIVISGPAGVGKDSVVKELQRRSPNFHFVVTATTRPMRAGEVHGVDYFFYSHEEFAGLINRDELLEYAHVYNDYKGIPKEQVRKALASGKDVIMRLDVQGAATIRQKIPGSISIFLTTTSEAELEKRLLARKSETDESYHVRMALARKELARLPEFDYVVINPENAMDAAVDTILAIILAEHHRVHQKRAVIK